MSVPTATVETSVVIGALGGQDPAALTLLDRALRGDFDIAVTTRLWMELTRTQPTAELRTYLEPRTIGAPARFDVSTFDGGDYWADADDVAAGDNFDGDHVAGHKRSGRVFFISRDIRQLKRARSIGISAVTPDEFLALFPV